MKKEEYVMSPVQARIAHSLGVAFGHTWAARWSVAEATRIHVLNLIGNSTELVLRTPEKSIEQLLGKVVSASHDQLASWTIDPIGYVAGSVKRDAQAILSFQIMEITGVVTGPQSQIGKNRISKEHWLLLEKIVAAMGISRKKIKIMFGGEDKETLEKILENLPQH